MKYYLLFTSSLLNQLCACEPVAERISPTLSTPTAERVISPEHQRMVEGVKIRHEQDLALAGISPKANAGGASPIHPRVQMLRTQSCPVMSKVG